MSSDQQKRNETYLRVRKVIHNTLMPKISAYFSASLREFDLVLMQEFEM